METCQWPGGLKRTRPRELVYAVLSRAQGPLDVQEIYRRTGQDLAMSTVYRALAAFEARGLVTKTTVMGEGTALYALRRADHAHYAYCLRCHRQIPLKGCPLAEKDLAAEAEGFQVTGHRLELYGYCARCRGAGGEEDPNDG